jgi:hypothetical protein
VRQDVEERLPVAIVNEPATGRGAGGTGSRAANVVDWSGLDSRRGIARHHACMVACGWFT